MRPWSGSQPSPWRFYSAHTRYVDLNRQKSRVGVQRKALCDVKTTPIRPVKHAYLHGFVEFAGKVKLFVFKALHWKERKEVCVGGQKMISARCYSCHRVLWQLLSRASPQKSTCLSPTSLRAAYIRVRTDVAFTCLLFIYLFISLFYGADMVSFITQCKEGFFQISFHLLPNALLYVVRAVALVPLKH